MFVAVRAPTRDDLAGVVARVVARVAKAFAQRAEDEGEGAADDALAGCRRAALARGSYGVVRDDGAVEASGAADAARFGRRPPKAQVAEAEVRAHARWPQGLPDAVRDRFVRVDRTLRVSAPIPPVAAGPGPPAVPSPAWQTPPLSPAAARPTLVAPWSQ